MVDNYYACKNTQHTAMAIRVGCHEKRPGEDQVKAFNIPCVSGNLLLDG